jgi:hypothetical protein
VGFGVRLLRKIIKNIEICIENVRFGFKDESRAVEIGVELPKITLEKAPDDPDVQDGRELHKLLHFDGIRGWFVPVAHGPATDWTVLEPLVTEVYLVHKPDSGYLGLSVIAEDRTKALSGGGVIIHSLQVEKTAQILRAMAEERNRRELLLCPLSLKSRVPDAQLYPSEAKAAFTTVYRAVQQYDLRLTELPPSSEQRAQLEDYIAAYPVRLLSRWQLHVDRELDRLAALMNPPEQKQGVIRAVAGGVKGALVYVSFGIFLQAGCPAGGRVHYSHGP